MGGLCESSTETVPTTSVSEVPAWVGQGGADLFSSAKNLAQEEYQPYGGPRVAEFSPDESQAFEMVRGAGGDWQPDFTSARGLVGQSTEAWGPEKAAEYMNPYSKNVLDVAANEMERRHGIRGKDRAARAVQFGAFGGAQHGVQEAESERNLEQNLGDLYGKGLGAAYDTAYDQFAGDRGQLLKGAGAYAGLGEKGAGLGYADAEALLRSGGMQRGLEQENIETAYRDFLEQREWPYKQIGYASDILRGTPYSTSTTGQTVVQQPSTLGQIGGLVGAGLGAYDYFN